MHRQCTSAVELVLTPRLAAGTDAVVGSGVVAVPVSVRVAVRCPLFLHGPLLSGRWLCA